MTLRSWLTRRVRLLTRRAAIERLAEDEFAYHIDMEMAEHVRAGMSPDEARRTALRDFGRVEAIKDEWRDERPLAWLDSFRRDFVFALRSIRRNPGFALSVMVVSAIGIGATSAMFGVVDGVLLRPLPFHDPGRLFSLQLRDESGNTSGVSRDAFAAIAGAPSMVTGAARYTIVSAVLTASDEPERLRGERVTSGLFSLLGWRPMLGRAFVPDDERDGGVVVLSHAFWSRRFAADSGIIGRAISLDGLPMTVIGVMPAAFGGSRPWLEAPAFWMPLDPARAAVASSVMLRLAPGVLPTTVADWLTRTTGPRAPNVTRTDSVDARAELVSITDLTVGDLRRPLTILFAGVGFVLLLVAVNITMLLLARGAARERELAVRSALGASRVRQIRHVLLESLLLAAGGGFGGLLLASFGLAVARSLGAAGLVPRIESIGLDWRVLLFAAAITAACGIGVGLVPAWRSARSNLAASLTGSARLDRGASRWGGVRGALVVAEVSLSMVILVGAGLMIKGFLRVLPSHPGFEVEHRLRMPVRLTRHPVYDDSLQGPGRRLQFVAEVKRRMERVDGVRAVGLTSFVPLVRESAISNVQLDGNAAGGESRLTAHHRTISPNYFDVMRMSITRGRAFSDNDAAGGPHVVIINETAARRWWPDHNPIGRQLDFTQGPARVRAEVIGVVNDVRFSGHSTRTQAEIYVPFAQTPPRVINFVVETSVDPRTLVTALRRTIWSVDPALPIDEAESLADVTREAVAIPRFYSTIMGAFAIIAIALAAAGIHSVLAFAVARRSREIGIRIALGAARRSVVMTVVRQGMALTAIGIVIGIAGAGALTRVLESVLFEVDPTDPAVFVLTTVVLLAVALLACVAPAVRAVNVDPLRALKSE